MKELPHWIEAALQGLAFWIGYRQSFYNDYHLPEGAIVAQVCSLIQANLPDELCLLPEMMYRNLTCLPMDEMQNLVDLTAQSRADLAVCAHCGEMVENKKFDRNGNQFAQVRYVFEVKRDAAAVELVYNDIRKLHAYLQTLPKDSDVRVFLVTVSESGFPVNFVERDSGIAKRGEQILLPCKEGQVSVFYNVRRVVKAATSFKSKERAHYACLIEIWRNSRIKSAKNGGLTKTATHEAKHEKEQAKEGELPVGVGFKQV